MIKKLKNYKKGIESEGFTIIEVMIVLAIAGLILLTVFLAVPALQRANRNTNRKQDAGHISTAIQDFVSNNSSDFPGYAAGTAPVATASLTTSTTSTWATSDCSSVYKDAGNLSVLNDSACTVNDVFPAAATWHSGTTLASGFYAANYESGTPTTTQTSDALVFDTYTVCSGNGPTTTNATSNNATLLYTIESGSNTYTWSCLTVQ